MMQLNTRWRTGASPGKDNACGKAANADIERRWLARLTLSILLATLGINLLSAYIRHVEAGLGCDDWPACYARIGVHISEHSKRVARAALAPQPFAKQTHRGVATALVVMVLLLVHRSRRQLSATEAQLPLAMAGLLLALAVIGPASYLKTRPAIAHRQSARWYCVGRAELASVPVADQHRTSERDSLAAQASAQQPGAAARTAGAGRLAERKFRAVSVARGGKLRAGRGLIDAFWYLRELMLDADGRVIATRVRQPSWSPTASVRHYRAAAAIER